MPRKHCVAAQPPLQDVLHTLIPPPPPSSSPPLLTARTILQLPPSPPPLSHTQNLLASLPDSWTICNVCLAPTTPTSKQHYLVLSQAGAQRDTVVAKVPLSDISLLEDFQDILVSSEHSMSLREKRSWWSARRKLDKRMEVGMASPATVCSIFTRDHLCTHTHRSFSLNLNLIGYKSGNPSY